tara:strand:+ start:8122 stop:8472 length:351 start_codon:yes stop_codon:yes gene_type:complete
MMFDTGTKFRYFHTILKEVYKIIEINYEMRDVDVDKLISIINDHLSQYNSKSGMVQMGSFFTEDSGSLDIYLSDYVRGRGLKKLFSDTIQIKSIMRDKLIDEILRDDSDIDMKLYE